MNRVSKAVVTGGAGFIGSHIVDELLKREIETIVIDNFSTGSIENLNQNLDNKLLHVIDGDARDIDYLLRDPEDIDVVFHEAAIASVVRSITEPLVVHDVNVNMTLKVMNFCVKNKVSRFVFASSAAVYGKIGDSKASEKMVCQPISPYGASKLSIENYLYSYYHSFGLPFVALRYFNVYGPRQKLNEYSGVITIFANQLLAGKQPTIFGDGNQVRDFVHVRDIVKANMLAMESDYATGNVFNVASGSSTSVLELFKTIREITKRHDIEPTFKPLRPGEVKIGLSDIQKIKRALDFEANYPKKEGLDEVVQFIKKKSIIDNNPTI